MADWRTWSPFQSQQTKEICAHLTESERRTVAARGALAGFAFSLIPQIPIYIHMAGLIPTYLMYILIGTLIAGVFASIPFLHASMRRFLCNTEWARPQGLKPEELALFDVRFGVKHLLALMVIVAVMSTLIWYVRP